MDSGRARHDWEALRKEYARGGLHESDLAADPFAMFDRWLADAVAAELPEPNAMVLASATPDGRPSARMVLLKGVTEFGFVFYTNLLSRKGTELAANPTCALLFPWHPLQRQVRVDGVASRLLGEDVAAYFRSRPREARLGAWASHQSRPVADRGELSGAYAEAEARFAAEEEIPVPPEWGGFVVRPEAFEFWQGRPGRMHDRLGYRRVGTGWTTYRLAP
jgi:pyridoxamine 5'-phosphate oxidase